MSKFTKKALEEVITERIIESLEKGTPSWVIPWSKISPKNAATGRIYSGLNRFFLGGESLNYGYSGWLTFNQVKKLGGKVIKGSSSTQAILLKPSIKKEVSEVTGEEIETPFFLYRSFNLFNLAQTEGLPEDLLEKHKLSSSISTDIVNDSEDKALAALQKIYSKKIDIRFADTPRAFFSLTGDYIQLPHQHSFDSDSSFIATLFHELSHWTGHSTRLNRSFGSKNTPEYAFEELIAELSASFLCARFGVDSQLENSASYIQSWLQALKNDKSYIFKAASEARKSAEYLLDLIGLSLNDENADLDLKQDTKAA